MVAYNNLHGAMKQGRGKDELGTTLVFLKDYTVQHFQMEEEFVKTHAYPAPAGTRTCTGPWWARWPTW